MQSIELKEQKIAAMKLKKHTKCKIERIKNRRYKIKT